MSEDVESRSEEFRVATLRLYNRVRVSRHKLLIPKSYFLTIL